MKAFRQNQKHSKTASSLKDSETSEQRTERLMKHRLKNRELKQLEAKINQFTLQYTHSELEIDSDENYIAYHMKNSIMFNRIYKSTRRPLSKVHLFMFYINCRKTLNEQGDSLVTVMDRWQEENLKLNLFTDGFDYITDSQFVTFSTPQVFSARKGNFPHLPIYHCPHCEFQATIVSTFIHIANVHKIGIGMDFKIIPKPEDLEKFILNHNKNMTKSEYLQTSKSTHLKQYLEHFNNNNISKPAKKSGAKRNNRNDEDDQMSEDSDCGSVGTNTEPKKMQNNCVFQIPDDPHLMDNHFHDEYKSLVKCYHKYLNHHNIIPSPSLDAKYKTIAAMFDSIEKIFSEMLGIIRRPIKNPTTTGFARKCSVGDLVMYYFQLTKPNLLKNATQKVKLIEDFRKYQSKRPYTSLGIPRSISQSISQVSESMDLDSDLDDGEAGAVEIASITNPSFSIDNFDVFESNAILITDENNQLIPLNDYLKKHNTNLNIPIEGFSKTTDEENDVMSTADSGYDSRNGSIVENDSTTPTPKHPSGSSILEKIDEMTSNKFIQECTFCFKNLV